jgi:hypothetical protein
MFAIRQAEKTRLIFDLRRVNAHLRQLPFSLDTLAVVPALSKDCRCASKLDLRAAYWQYPIDETLSACLATTAPGISEGWLRWRCLPFGLSVAPFVFAALTGAFVRAWRAAGLVVVGYLDDFLILAASVEEHARAVHIVVSDLIRAGLRISSRKAFLMPYIVIDFLGLSIDLGSRSFGIPAKYALKITEGAKELLRRDSSISLRQLQVFLGRLAFIGVAVPWASAFRAHLTAMLAGEPSVANLTLSEEAAEELRWWIDEAPTILLNRAWPWRLTAHTKLFFRHGTAPLPEVILHGDASDSGVGFELISGEIASEPLPPELPPSAPSVARELYAMVRMIERNVFREGAVVRFVSDSTGAVRTALGATAAPSSAPLARRLFLAALQRGVVVQTEWAPRSQLRHVDEASRRDADDATHARHAHEVVARLVRQAWGEAAVIDVEFFCSVHNRVSPPSARFCTAYPLPGSSGDGLNPAIWKSALHGWAYPPFGLLHPVLRLAVEIRPKAILVLPDSSLVRATLRGWMTCPVEAPLAPPMFAQPLRGIPLLAAFWLPGRG